VDFRGAAGDVEGDLALGGDEDGDRGAFRAVAGGDLAAVLDEHIGEGVRVVALPLGEVNVSSTGSPAAWSVSSVTSEASAVPMGASASGAAPFALVAAAAPTGVASEVPIVSAAKLGASSPTSRPDDGALETVGGRLQYARCADHAVDGDA
jgi:hypothetical protein